MISIPAYGQFDKVTVFRDDVDKTKFYYLPRQPRVALYPDGKPMFTFLRYQFPLNRPDGSEPGGGYLVFTTAMTEDEDTVRSITDKLDTALRAEDPTSTTVPHATLAPVDFAEGAATLIIMKDSRMIKAVSLGSPSLFGDNTASVAIELNADAATLFHEALKGGGSVAAIEYDLRFPVRLPAITIIGHVDAHEVKQAVMTYTTEHVTDESTWGDRHHNEEHRTSISEKMDAMGLIQLEILKGDVNLSSDDMESLRAFAFKAMDEFIKNHFLAGGTIETDEDRKSQWMQFIGHDIKDRFDLNVSYHDVILRSYNPSAQVSPAFLGVPLDKVVQDIDLASAPWYFNTLTVQVDTNMDFVKYDSLVYNVVGHLSYDQAAPDGTRVTKRQSFPFTRTDRAPKKFESRIAALGKDTYHVDLEVNYKSGPRQQVKLASFDSTTRNLTLSVPNPGVIELTFMASPKSFSADLTSIEVEIDYADPQNGVPKATETVILDATKPERPYSRTIYAPWDKPFHYRITYVYATQRSTTPWMEGSSGQQYVSIPTPAEDQFGLQVLASADWKEISQIIIDLEYEDHPNDLHQKKTISFSKEAQARQPWEFALRNPDLREYSYTQTLLYTNGAVVTSASQTRPSDAQVLVVGNAPGGVVAIDVDPTDVGLPANAQRVVVRLTYSDPPNNVLDTETLVFRDGAVKQWSIARADAKKNDYTYDVEYFLKDGSHRKLVAQSGVITSWTDYLPLPPVPPA